MLMSNKVHPIRVRPIGVHPRRMRPTKAHLTGMHSILSAITPTTRPLSTWPASLLAVMMATLLTIPTAAAEDSPDTSAMADTSVMADTSAMEDTSVLEALAHTADMRQQIAEYESNGDTWRPEITEVLLSLGRQLQDLNEHEDALLALERAVHLARVNQGLFAPQQLPAVAMQIDSYLALGDWQQADSLYQYMFIVESRAFPELSPEQIPSLERFVQWHISAYEERRGEYPAARLLDAYHLLSVILTIVERQPDPDLYPREQYLEQMAYVAWLMHLTGVQRRPEAQMTNIRWVEEGWIERTTDNRHRHGRNPYLQGRRALEGIAALRAAALRQTDPEHPEYWEARRKHAEALLNLADWQLMFARRQGAAQSYQDAWEALEGAPTPLRDRGCERVVVLPAYRDALRRSRSGASDDRVVVFAPASDDVWQQPEVASAPSMLIQFDINRFGHSARVSVLEAADELEEREQRRMLNLLRNNLLRPQIREGQPAHVEDLEYRFAYMIESHLQPRQ